MLKLCKRYLPLIMIGLTLCLLFCAAPQAKAEDYSTRTIDEASPQEIVDGMANKLFRGVANIATGWLEIPKQIYTTSKEEGVASGVLVGPIKGLGMTLVRTGAGIGETATFFVAYPGFFDPLFDPPFVWRKE